MRRLGGALLGTLAMLAPPAAAQESWTAEEIEHCVRARQPQDAARQQLRIEIRSPSGDVESVAAEVSWRRGREGRAETLVRLSQHPRYQGGGLLMLENRARDDLFMYLPGSDHVRRMPPQALMRSLFGTDLGYEHFLDFLHPTRRDRSTRRLADVELGGRPTFCLESVPRTGANRDAALLFVDQEHCVVVRTEFYRDDELARVVSADLENVRRIEDVWVSERVVIEDRLDRSRTELFVERFQPNPELPASIFSVSALESRSRR